MFKIFPFILLFSSALFASPVNVNSADAQTISVALIGVNVKKAEALVAYRETHGDFNQLEDLKQVIGFGEKTIAVNKSDILFTDKKIAVTNPVIVQTTSAIPESSESDFPWLATAALLSIAILLAFLIHKHYRRKKAIPV